MEPSSQHLTLHFDLETMYLPTLLTLAKSLALAFVLALAIADESTNPELVAKLRAAGTQVDRLKLLPNDTTDWTFDFTTQPGYTFQPASVISANVASFPVRPARPS